jgi:hypothetical protein
MPQYKTPAHDRAEAAFKKPPSEDRKGLGNYETSQAASLANMKRLRAERLARDGDPGSKSGTANKTRQGARKTREG